MSKRGMKITLPVCMAIKRQTCTRPQTLLKRQVFKSRKTNAENTKKVKRNNPSTMVRITTTVQTSNNVE